MEKPSQQTIAAKVGELVAEQLHIDAGTVTGSATLTSLGADSLDVVELIMRFEDEFDVEIDDEAAERLHTVQDVVSYLHELVQKRTS